VNAAYGGQLATVADLQPMIAQLNALPTLAQINAAVQAALVPHNAPAIAAAASATVLTNAAARARNAHDRDDEAYAVVLRVDGTPPPNWPAGFDRSALAACNNATAAALLADYQLPLPVTLRARRNALARHIGTPCF
jgi:hypothetical protein